jgi:hypothetical protein
MAIGTPAQQQNLLFPPPDLNTIQQASINTSTVNTQLSNDTGALMNMMMMMMQQQMACTQQRLDLQCQEQKQRDSEMQSLQSQRMMLMKEQKERAQQQTEQQTQMFQTLIERIVARESNKSDRGQNATGPNREGLHMLKRPRHSVIVARHCE